MKRLILFSFSLIFFLGCARMNYKSGNDLYKREAYAAAIPYFQKAIEKDGTPEAFGKLADCYRSINKYEEAEIWYGRVIELGIQEPDHLFEYARILHKNGKYEEAKTWYTNYSALNPDDERVKNAIRFLDNKEKYSRPSPRIEVSQLSINSEMSDFAPTFYRGGIIFCTERNTNGKRVYDRTGRPYVDLYYSKFGPLGNLLEPVPLNYQLSSEYHDGPGAFDEINRQLFLTRSNLRRNQTLEKSSNRTNHLQLYIINTAVGGWRDARPFEYNSKEFSTGHATITSDGLTMFFISDKPGGKGGTDLYKSSINADGRWGVPESLGDLLNTPGDEMFPYFVEKENGDQLLYFASDGHPGLGGLDIFVSKFENGIWLKPEHLPAPINSSSDDFGLITEEKGFVGYFSSNRDSSGEFDKLYRFGQKTIHVAGLVIDQETGIPLPQTTVNIQFDGDNQSSGLKVDEEARFHFDMEWNDAVDIFASLKGYLPENVNISGTESVSDTINVTLELAKLKDIVLIGITKDAKTGLRLGNVNVDLLNQNTRRLSAKVSDRDGNFEFGLAPETDFVVTGKKVNYYLDRKRLTTKGKGSHDTMYVELILSPFELEKPVVLENIYYDLDKWFIRQDAAPELNKLASILQDNPEITIELMSHTDSRASNRYNQRLSQKRANAAVEYLVNRGIDKSRIIAVGYGESRLLNHCSNGVKCSETEHQKNRRTEFKIIKIGEIILSQPKDNVPVNTGLRAVED